MVFSKENVTDNFAWKFVSGVISLDEFALHISVDVVYFMNMEDIFQEGNTSSILIFFNFSCAEHTFTISHLV
mgnify:CR=1 FL=1